MDVVGIQLHRAHKLFSDQGINYTVEYTRPYSRSFSIIESSWYVIRQYEKEDGSVCLLAAAKMGKEVF